MRLLLFTVLLTFFGAGCAHSYVYSTGMPADVSNRFFFHLEQQAVDEGYRTGRSDTGLSVYAAPGSLHYAVDADQIAVTLSIPNKSGATSNYYRMKRQQLERINDDLIEGARLKARDAKDFAY